MRKEFFLTGCFGLSLRSLAAMRIATAILLLADLIDRALTIGEDYTDAGIFPRSAFVGSSDWDGIWSLFLANGSLQWAIAHAIVSATTAILLALGWRCKIITPLCWLLLLSLQARMPHSNDSGDVILRSLLFWGMFLPWGERWSLSSPISPTDPRIANSVCNLGTLAYVGQIIIIYLFSVLWKFNRSWLLDGSAVYYALHQDKWTTNIGRAFLDLPFVYQRIATHLTILLELSVLLLLLPALIAISALRYQRIRLCLVVLFCGFHASLRVFLDIGFLPWICCVVWIGILPDCIWELKMLRYLSTTIDAYLRRVAISEGIALTILGKWLKRWGQSIYALAPLVLFAWVAWLNLASKSLDTQPQWLVTPAEAMGLIQKWDMFAGMPFYDDGWLLVELRNEERKLGTYNISEQKVSDWKEPVAYRGYRFKRIEVNLINREAYRRPALERFCRLDERAKEVALYFVLDRTPEPGELTVGVKREKLETIPCPSMVVTRVGKDRTHSIELLGG